MNSNDIEEFGGYLVRLHQEYVAKLIHNRTIGNDGKAEVYEDAIRAIEGIEETFREMFRVES
jgi:hypothetical protein